MNILQSIEMESFPPFRQNLLKTSAVVQNTGKNAIPAPERTSEEPRQMFSPSRPGTYRATAHENHAGKGQSVASGSYRKKEQ